MSIDLLKSASAALTSLTPEGRHIPHRYGSAADKAALKATADSETDSAVRMVRREQLSKFIVVSDEHAAKHHATLARKTKSADALIEALGLRGRGKPGVIAEADARRYLVKTFRETRHQLAAGSEVDLTALSEKVAEHLGATNTTAVLAAVTAEHDAFAAEHAAAVEELGAHHVFHEDIGFLDSRLQA